VMKVMAVLQTMIKTQNLKKIHTCRIREWNLLRLPPTRINQTMARIPDQIRRPKIRTKVKP
jgi:hypothetical protein